jgi:hypothetical protein
MPKLHFWKIFKASFSFCPAGSFSDGIELNSFCKKCIPGKFSVDEGRLSCVECQSGSYNPITGSSTCKECSVGLIALSGADECITCSRGRYSSFYF